MAKITKRRRLKDCLLICKAALARARQETYLAPGRPVRAGTPGKGGRITATVTLRLQRAPGP